MSNGFKKYDAKATEQNVDRELWRYQKLKKQEKRLKLVALSGQAYDGMPHSKTNVNGTEEAVHKRLEDQEWVKKEMILLETAVSYVGDESESAEQASAILKWRYIDGYSLTKCCLKFGQAFADGYPLARTTMNDKLKAARLRFSEIYPRELRVEA